MPDEALLRPSGLESLLEMVDEALRLLLEVAWPLSMLSSSPHPFDDMVMSIIHLLVRSHYLEFLMAKAC